MFDTDYFKCNNCDSNLDHLHSRSASNRGPSAVANRSAPHQQHLPKVVPPESFRAMTPTLEFRTIRWLQKDYWLSQFRRIRVS